MGAESGNIPVPTEEEPDVLDDKQAKSLIDFDYFDTPQEEVEEIAAQQEEREPAAEGEAEAEAPVEEEVEEEADEEPEGAVWQRDLAEAIRSLKQTPQVPIQATSMQEEAPPVYNFQVKQEIADALGSEDAAARAAAVNAIANGVAQTVHAQIRSESAARTQRVVQDYVARHLTQRTTQQAIAQDFYGKYPQLDTPAKRAAVIAVAQQVYDGSSPWSPKLRDKIANTVAAELGISLAGPAGQQNGASGAEQNKQSGAGKKPGRKPPKQIAGGARPGTPARTGAQQNDIFDTLFGSDAPRR
jgi:hypothetical protein